MSACLHESVCLYANMFITYTFMTLDLFSEHFVCISLH